MTRLIDDPDAVAALAGRVSDQTSVPVAHVEKDFWVTEVLRGVAASADALGLEVLFKGGTSLSKVFSMIDRFSEDIDLLVLLPDDSRGAHDRALKSLCEGAERSTGITGLVDGATTTTGVKRSVRFPYRTEVGDRSGVSPGVLLELGTRGGALGSTRASVRSLIAEHIDDVAGEPEAAPVYVRVMSPWRTLVEKLVLLHTAHSDDDPGAAQRGARHLYDVHRLLDRPEVRAGIAEAGIVALSRDVCTYSRIAGLPAADRPKGGFAESPAFVRGRHTSVVEDHYNSTVLGQLLWPGRRHPSFDDCLGIVHLHADLL